MPTPSELRCDCPCGAKLWKLRKGEWTLANRILKLGPDNALQAVCPECRTPVPIPWLTLSGPTAVAPTPSPTPGVGMRFVVRAPP